MNDVELMKRVFDGYVFNYRNNNWHTKSNYSDMTFLELGFFSRLGNYLGFHVRREMNYEYPRDLCWCDSFDGSDNDIDAKTFLYIERENEDNRAINNTIRKMLIDKNSKDIPNFLAVFGWIRPETLKLAKNIIDEKFENPNSSNKTFSIISWIGKSKEDPEFSIECWIKSSVGEYTKTATPKIDECGFWYIQPNDSQWQLEH